MSTWLYTPCASVHVHKHPVPWITCIGTVDEADICTSSALAPNTLVLPIPFHKHFTGLNSYYSSVNLDTWLWMLSVISLPIPWHKLTQCSISLLTMYVKALYSNSHSCGPLYHTIYNIPFTSTIAVLHQQSSANAMHMWATPYNNTGSVPEGMLWIGCHDTTTMEPHLLNVPMINSSFYPYPHIPLHMCTIRTLFPSEGCPNYTGSSVCSSHHTRHVLVRTPHTHTHFKHTGGGPQTTNMHKHGPTKGIAQYDIIMSKCKNYTVWRDQLQWSSLTWECAAWTILSRPNTR